MIKETYYLLVMLFNSIYYLYYLYYLTLTQQQIIYLTLSFNFAFNVHRIGQMIICRLQEFYICVWHTEKN